VTASTLPPVAGTDIAADLAGTMAAWAEDLDRRETAAKVDRAEHHLLAHDREVAGLAVPADAVERERLDALVEAIGVERATLERLRPSSDGGSLMALAMLTMAVRSEALRVGNGERARS